MFSLLQKRPIALLVKGITAGNYILAFALEERTFANFISAYKSYYCMPDYGFGSRSML